MFEKTSPSQAPARPAVVQRRGIERRRAILDAAEALLAEQGYEAATLKAIGERAGIPTASVYHYFSDRHQVDAELLQRHVGQMEPLLGAALQNPEPRTLRAAADAVIDPMLGYFRSHPSCVELWYAGRHDVLVELVRAFDEAQAERLWHFLVERGLIAPDTPQLVLQLAFEAGNRLFDVAFRRSPTGDDTTIDEARRLVTAYLDTYAPHEPERRA
ncbi:TetR/AcrR family transcriptional regulator [Streptomyces sp. NPDC005813]|uniref:TetR/AcrR family transcriptional regulator n=1 Tax=Streptomyces sp. NPDC005813 TaxID=3155592 RepID=UPI0033D96020